MDQRLLADHFGPRIETTGDQIKDLGDETKDLKIGLKSGLRTKDFGRQTKDFWQTVLEPRLRRLDARPKTSEMEPKIETTGDQTKDVNIEVSKVVSGPRTS